MKSPDSVSGYQFQVPKASIHFLAGVLIVDEDGVTYKGERVSDAGEVYKALLDCMSGKVTMTNQPPWDGIQTWWDQQSSEIADSDIAEALREAQTAVINGDATGALKAIRVAAENYAHVGEKIRNRVEKDDFQYIQNAINELKRAGEPDLVPGGWGISLYVGKLVDRYLEAKKAAAEGERKIFNQLQECMGYIRNGTDQTIHISQDDATETYWITCGNREPRRSYYGDNLKEALQKAYEGERQF